MKNDAYWAERMKLLEKALLDKGYEYTQNLEAQFAEATRSVEKELAAWYQRLAKNNEINLADAKKLLNAGELKEFSWSVEEYIKRGRENALDGRWLRELENASARVHISRLDSIKLQLQQQAEALYGNQLDGVDELVRDIYSDSFYHTAFELQKGIGVGWSFMTLNEDAISKVLSRPWTADGQTFRDRCWTNKEALVRSVNKNLTQMIMRGEAPDKVIAAISKEFGVWRRKAGRLVMTESAAFASAGQRDCYNALDVEKYRIVETLDSETCPLCGELDGKVFKMSDFAVGETAPPFHPWCRGCTCPHFDDMDSERAARDADGKTYYVPSDMKYGEWKSTYVNDATLKKDKLEFDKFRNIQGNKSPKTLDEFVKLKYNNTSEYKQLKKEAEKTEFRNWQKDVADKNAVVAEFKTFSNSADVPQWMKEQAAHWSKSEKEALTYYTTHEYSKINNYLRGKATAESFIQSKIANISSAIGNARINENIVVWRGTYLSNFTQGDWLKNNPTQSWKKHDISDMAFSSTSILKDHAFDTEVFMQILVPKGSNGAYIRELSDITEEYEMLFQKGSKFKIIHAEERNRKIFMRVTYKGAD